MANTPKGTTATRSGKTAPAKNPAKTAAPRKARTSSSRSPRKLSADLRRQMIAEAAYLRAERRGFSPGDPNEDWLEAEREVDLLLAERTDQIAQ